MGASLLLAGGGYLDVKRNSTGGMQGCSHCGLSVMVPCGAQLLSSPRNHSRWVADSDLAGGKCALEDGVGPQDRCIAQLAAAKDCRPTADPNVGTEVGLRGYGLRCDGRATF